MIAVALSALVLLVALGMFATRNEDHIREVWAHILSPAGWRYCEILARQASALQRAITWERAAVAQARLNGEPERAAGLERALTEYERERARAFRMRKMLSAVSRPYETETQDERRRASFLRRMLSAIGRLD